MFSRLIVLIFLAFVVFGCTQAKDGDAGGIVIEQPVVRATPPGAPVSGGYLVIKNTGSESDRLTGGSAAFANKVRIHEMSMDDGVMKMREVEGGLEIAPGESVVLQRGGIHLMFMQLSEQLKEGDTRKVRLIFEKVGEIEVEFNVGNLAGN